MNKKFTTSIMVLIFMFIITAAHAGNPYVSLKGSVGSTDMGAIKFSHIPEGLVNATNTGSSDTSNAAGLAMGYDIGNVRVEFEYMNRSKITHDTSLAILNGGVTIDGQYVPFNGPGYGFVDWIKEFQMYLTYTQKLKQKHSS